MEFTVKEVAVFRVATFWSEVICQMYFLRITVQIYTTRCDFNKDYCNKFDDSNFDIDSYYFLLHVKLL